MVKGLMDHGNCLYVIKAATAAEYFKDKKLEAKTFAEFKRIYSEFGNLESWKNFQNKYVYPGRTIVALTRRSTLGEGQMLLKIGIALWGVYSLV